MAVQNGHTNGHAEKAPISEKAAVPKHSPNGSDETAVDNSALMSELYPADSWILHNGQMTYWADLPNAERHAYIWRTEGAQFSHMFGTTWAEFKRDPLLPVINYWNNYVLPGFGLFTEGYVLFSIGNLKTLFSAAWPQCWKTYTVCNIRSVQTTDYLQVVGIIFGQAGVGIEADWIGRRFGLIQDATIMLLGATLIAAVWGTSLQGWIAGYAVSQFIYGCGVGGEYPITATTSMERASKGRATAEDRLHRGRKTVGAFLMQGWGQFVNQGLLIILLLISNSSGQGPYSVGAAQVTYRLSFVFVAICVLWLLYYRIFRQKGADNALQRAKSKVNVSGYDAQSFKLALTYFWPRIIATAGGWWANDFQFYGAKVFASDFIPIVIGGSPSVMTTWLYNLLNVGIALIGYYFGFMLIDAKFYGRWRMQVVGFLLTFLIFLVVTASWDQIRVAGPPIHAFQWLYFMSSFFQQFGPNCVTFLVAAEVYPAAIRGSAHGMSAAIGKVGALIPTVLYNYIDDRNKFIAGTVTGFFGLIVTIVFLPDVSGLDLHEQERRWLCIRAGRPQDYHGIAIHPRHLSLWERYVQKQHLNYDAVLDRKQRLAELRDIFEREQANLVTEGDGKLENTVNADDESELSPALVRFFALERRSSTDTLIAHHIPEPGSGLVGTPRTGDALQ